MILAVVIIHRYLLIDKAVSETILECLIAQWIQLILF